MWYCIIFNEGVEKKKLPKCFILIFLINYLKLEQVNFIKLLRLIYQLLFLILNNKLFGICECQIELPINFMLKLNERINQVYRL